MALAMPPVFWRSQMASCVGLFGPRLWHRLLVDLADLLIAVEGERQVHRLGRGAHGWEGGVHLDLVTLEARLRPIPAHVHRCVGPLTGHTVEHGVVALEATASGVQ